VARHYCYTDAVTHAVVLVTRGGATQAMTRLRYFLKGERSAIVAEGDGFRFMQPLAACITAMLRARPHSALCTAGSQHPASHRSRGAQPPAAMQDWTFSPWGGVQKYLYARFA
jgi:hypothetical protein